jgi:acyl carrier protein
MTNTDGIERFIVDEIMIGRGQKHIAPDQSLIESNILDSLALLRLIGFIEDRYKITVEDGEVIPENFNSLEQIGAYIDEKRKS